MTVDPFVDQFISNLETRFTKTWAPYLFHYSDILNVVSILKHGALYSRNHCTKKGLLKTDSAGKGVLIHTSSSHKDHVRLYFRPRTPPLYHIEGFCPNGNRGSKFDAHCPVPIYLVFDSREVLSDPQAQFSNRNLSGVGEIFDDKRGLGKLDFGQIYHDTYFTRDQQELKREIVNRRCSEVILPNQLQLEGVLKYIVCRSTAERETLINLLSDELKKQYSKTIAVGISFFNHKKHYIRKVNLQKTEIGIEYNEPQLKPFQYTYFFKTGSGARSYEKDKPVYKWYWKNPRDEYVFSIKIDDHIAYEGKFIL